MKKKRAFTLLEIMIVIFLIGLIGSVIGFSMKGSMDEGRAFKTEQAISKLEDIFELEMAKGAKAEKIVEDDASIEHHLVQSGIVKNPKKLMKDGWGEKFNITQEGGVITITSDKYEAFLLTKDDYEDDNG